MKTLVLKLKKKKMKWLILKISFLRVSFRSDFQGPASVWVRLLTVGGSGEGDRADREIPAQAGAPPNLA